MWYDRIIRFTVWYDRITLSLGSSGIALNLYYTLGQLCSAHIALVGLEVPEDVLGLGILGQTDLALLTCQRQVIRGYVQIDLLLEVNSSWCHLPT